jgi:hypothetical protein
MNDEALVAPKRDHGMSVNLDVMLRNFPFAILEQIHLMLVIYISSWRETKRRGNPYGLMDSHVASLRIMTITKRHA